MHGANVFCIGVRLCAISARTSLSFKGQWWRVYCQRANIYVSGMPWWLFYCRRANICNLIQGMMARQLPGREHCCGSKRHGGAATTPMRHHDMPGRAYVPIFSPGMPPSPSKLDECSRFLYLRATITLKAEQLFSSPEQII